MIAGAPLVVTWVLADTICRNRSFLYNMTLYYSCSDGRAVADGKEGKSTARRYLRKGAIYIYHLIVITCADIGVYASGRDKYGSARIWWTN